MMIGKAGAARTSICTSDASSITVRGRDLTSQLMGRIGFSEYFFLLVTGREPTKEQSYFLDLLLVAIAEHGLTPSAVAARMTLAADPNSLQAAVAAGILGCGSVVLGTAEYCAKVLVDAKSRVAHGVAPPSAAAQIAHEVHQRREFMPGFGHPIHHPIDPRAERILQLVEERGVGGEHVAMAKLLLAAVQQEWGRPLPMNVSMPIAAVLLDLDFPVGLIKAIPILARTAGVLGHLAEEQQQPIGFLMAFHADAAINFTPPGA